MKINILKKHIAVGKKRPFSANDGVTVGKPIKKARHNNNANSPLKRLPVVILFKIGLYYRKLFLGYLIQILKCLILEIKK